MRVRCSVGSDVTLGLAAGAAVVLALSACVPRLSSPPARESASARFAVAASEPSPPGLIFDEGWESGDARQSFNSRDFGSAVPPQFIVQSALTGGGRFALEHRLLAGMSPGAIQYATQHFGDALAAPVLPAGQGRHFSDLYVQYKVAYSRDFEMGPGYKQLIIGTQDDRRHPEPCCNPWVAHYLTVFPAHPNMKGLQAEVNNKQEGGGRWIALGQNAGGFNSAHPFVMEMGRFYRVEVRRRLNEPGRDDGIFQMWIDGVLVADHRTVRYRGPASPPAGALEPWGTNFVMISDYSTEPPARDQSVFYDDIRIATAYIGP